MVPTTSLSHLMMMMEKIGLELMPGQFTQTTASTAIEIEIVTDENNLLKL
jgi:hypothetical protein